MITRDEEHFFITSISRLTDEVHNWAIRKGFWEGYTEEHPRNKSEMLMLMVTELAECCEGIRVGNPPDDKVPELSAEEAELADTVIRILDYCGGHRIDLGRAILLKMAYNETREKKHGKQF